MFTEDFNFDILIILAFLKFRDYESTLYSTDYREKNRKTRRLLSFLKAYNKSDKLKYFCHRLEFTYRYYQVHRFRKLLTPEFLDKTFEELLPALIKDTNIYYNEKIGDINLLKDALPESELRSLFSSYKKPKRRRVNKSTKPSIKLTTTTDSLKAILNLCPILSRFNSSSTLKIFMLCKITTQ